MREGMAVEIGQQDGCREVECPKGDGVQVVIFLNESSAESGRNREVKWKSN